ncbi:hypothetical protein J2W40_002185 [Sphingobium xenophagum]|uniref:Uncharacterized protein n=1 Tax=Sphingobium xenophagum TaxID=121428 RepID=A0ABU1X1C0_SPHXE|nr:hypothetical protein [Sphingobium xenophagum]
MRLYSVRTDMQPNEDPSGTTRAWLSGLAVVIAVVVSFIGFSRVSIGWTLVVSTAIFLGLITFLWVAGGGKKG